MREPDKILRMRTVLERTGLSRATIYRKIKDGSFPAQLRISVHGCGWRESEINRWIADPENYGTQNGRAVAANSNSLEREIRTESPDRRPERLRQDGAS